MADTVSPRQQLQRVASRLNSGALRVFAAAVPRDADALLDGGGRVLLAELRFQAQAFTLTADAGGRPVLVASPLLPDLAARASGAPTFWRAYPAGSESAALQGTAGGPASGADIE